MGTRRQTRQFCPNAGADEPPRRRRRGQPASCGSLQLGRGRANTSAPPTLMPSCLASCGVTRLLIGETTLVFTLLVAVLSRLFRTVARPLIEVTLTSAEVP